MCIQFLIKKRSKPRKVHAGDGAAFATDPEEGLGLRNADDVNNNNLKIPEIPKNPFFLDLVIIKILEHADVSSLKELRRLDVKWKHLATKELEKRASKGQLKAVDLSGEFCQEKIDYFLYTTRSNPKLFRSFRLNFASLNLKDKCRRISTYSPLILQLDIKNKPTFLKNDKKALHFFLALIAPKIQELEIHIHDPLYSHWSQIGHHRGPVLPKLTRFACIGNPQKWYGITELFQLFEFILTKGGKFDHTPNLTTLEMKINMLNIYPHFEFTPIGLSRWSSLTHLTIHVDDIDNIWPTTFLCELGEAGMKLETLDLILNYMDEVDWPAVSSNLSNFFQTQAKSLKFLDLTAWCTISVEEEDIANSKIRLPIFEVLDTLKLKGSYHATTNEGINDSQMFEMGPFPVHFPKLDYLAVHAELLPSLFPEGVVAPMHLLEFSILYNARTATD